MESFYVPISGDAVSCQNVLNLIVEDYIFLLTMQSLYILEQYSCIYHVYFADVLFTKHLQLHSYLHNAHELVTIQNVTPTIREHLFTHFTLIWFLSIEIY